MEKAKQLAQGLNIKDFYPINGSLERWNERNNITFKKLNDEKQDVDYFGAESWIRNASPAVIKNYKAKDIFNTNETGLYSRVIREGTFSLKDSETAACKMAKKRATLLFACNMDESEKPKPLTIGKSKNTRCFKNMKTLPVDYEANKDSLMTRYIWTAWLNKMDNQTRCQN